MFFLREVRMIGTPIDNSEFRRILSRNISLPLPLPLADANYAHADVSAVFELTSYTTAS